MIEVEIIADLRWPSGTNCLLILKSKDLVLEQRIEDAFAIKGKETYILTGIVPLMLLDNMTRTNFSCFVESYASRQSIWDTLKNGYRSSGNQSSM